MLVVAVVALAGLLVRILRGRGPEEQATIPLERVEALPPEMEAAMSAGTVLGHFITSYALGNDHYDDSFSVETDAGVGRERKESAGFQRARRLAVAKGHASAELRWWAE